MKRPLANPGATSPKWVRAWRADTPTRTELQRAYARFQNRRSRDVRVARAGGWLLSGLLLGFGVAYAATGEPLPHVRAAFAPSPSRAKPTWSAPRPGRKPQTARNVESPSFESEPSKGRAAPSESSGLSAARAPVSARPVEPSTSRRENASKTSAASGGAPADVWQRAARGLREGDFDSTNQALLELEAEPSAVTRETARLTRAELLIATNQSEAARDLLGELGERASSAHVREKARRLLQRLEKNAAGGRSDSPPRTTNEP